MNTFRLFLASQGLRSLSPCLDIKQTLLWPPRCLSFIYHGWHLCERDRRIFLHSSLGCHNRLDSCLFSLTAGFLLSSKDSFLITHVKCDLSVPFEHFNTLVFPYVLGKMWILMISWWLLRDLFEVKLCIHISEHFFCSLTAKMHDLIPSISENIFETSEMKMPKKKSNLSLLKISRQHMDWFILSRSGSSSLVKWYENGLKTAEN